MARINFTNNINVSAQVGDMLFHHVGVGDAGTELGVITSVGPNFVEIDDADVSTAVASDFFSFKKSSDSNYYANSSVKGYYAKIKLSNSQSAKQELFYLGSEITESSK
tara:strand:- start:136 stop:459 length:324 start_codon:yes stop_codon:yes gene_type:complete